MEREYKIEELYENLPDFINGRIEDANLRNAIITEIEANSEFKYEFESLNSISNNIKNISFSEPPDNYFNNLLPQINERIYSTDKQFSFKKRFSAIWKFALPLTAVILMYFGYNTFFVNNEYINNFKSDSQIIIKDNNSLNTGDNDNVYKDIDTYGDVTPMESKENDEIISGKTKSSYLKQDVNDRGKITEDNNIAIDITDNNPDDDVFFSGEDEPNIEQEFDKLNSDEQNKILSEIKNSKF
jgi:hypothetical protein